MILQENLSQVVSNIFIRKTLILEIKHIMSQTVRFLLDLID